MQAGAAKAGRSAADVDLLIPVFIVPGDTPEDRALLARRARTQIGFYGSTRNYAFQFDDLGFEGTSAKLNERLKAGDLDGLAATITDEMLDVFAIVGTLGRHRRPDHRSLRRSSPSGSSRISRSTTSPVIPITSLAGARSREPCATPT